MMALSEGAYFASEEHALSPAARGEDSELLRLRLSIRAHAEAQGAFDDKKTYNH